jgi:hypothetical protein
MMEEDKISVRAKTVFKALEKVMKVMEDRDRLKAIEEYLLRTKPEVVLNAIREGKTIPRYFVDLVATLTELYDQGYADGQRGLR